MPRGWQERLITISNANTGGVEGLCLEVHDLAISKYVAGRDKDLDFTATLAHHRLLRKETLLERLPQTKLAPRLRKLVAGRISRDFGPNRPG